jgi:hypothetical protein
MSPNQILRYSDAAGYKRSEFVTVLEATPAQVREFSCLANQVLAAESEDAIRPMPTDTASKWFALLANGRYMKLPNGKSSWELQDQLKAWIAAPMQEQIRNAYKR